MVVSNWLAVSILITLGFICFILFAIWRAILGKSSVDFAKVEQLKKNTKSVNSLAESIKKSQEAEMRTEKSHTELRKTTADLEVTIKTLIERFKSNGLS